MTGLSGDNPCPCESGLSYPNCCGAKLPEGEGIQPAIPINYDNFDRLPLNIQQAIENLCESPELFPLDLDLFQQQVRWIKMSPIWYEESIFLDDKRILGTYALSSDTDWLIKKTKSISIRPSAYIFHTAFCGSTLMSKALANLYNCLPLREPEILGGMLRYLHSSATESQKKQWLDRVLVLLSRRFEEKQSVVIKANDYTCELMTHIAENYPDIPLLFMYTPLNEFVAACLKSESRQQWLRERYHLVKNRAANILDLVDESIDDVDFGKMAAVYWSYNIELFLRTWRSHGTQTKSLCFSDFIAEPQATVQSCASYFNLVGYSFIDPAAEMGSLFSVYSKGQNAYSPQRRRQEIEQVLADNKIQLFEAEALAQCMLGQDYPEARLPGAIEVEPQKKIKTSWFKRLFPA